MCPTVGQSGLRVARDERRRVPWSLLSSQFCSSRLRGRIQSTQPDRVQRTRSASRDSAQITGNPEVDLSYRFVIDIISGLPTIQEPRMVLESKCRACVLLGIGRYTSGKGRTRRMRFPRVIITVT